jgi:hypothetical protein
MPWLTTNGVSLNQCSVSLPPLGVGGSWHFQGGGKKHPKNRTLRTIFFHSFMSRFTTTPPPPQPMAFPMSLSDGSSRLMSHHSSCFMSHGSSCPMMTLVSCLTSHGVSCRTVHGSSWLLMGGRGGISCPAAWACLITAHVSRNERSKKKKKRQSPHPTTHPLAPCLPGEEKEKKKKWRGPEREWLGRGKKGSS